ncbi:MAG TPA: MFS transporter, partial [Kouleothrix sp.]|nr:MFS transporter [Kouleothrix sp.]
MAASSAMGLRQPGRGMRAFLLIWAGQLISILGSQLTGFALGVWVYQTTGSVTQLTLISFFASIPFLAVTPLAGALVDRWNLRWTMLLGDLGGAFATLAYLALLASGLLQIWHIYIIVAITAVFGAFQFPALSVATTLIVPKEQLGRASGLNPLAQGIAQLLGPLLAGVLVALVGLPGVIAIDFASCLF